MNPRGVSLLEVLFAMLVGTIGLLGAISLLPVAIEQANKGREADAQMIVGESAIEEFKIRGGYLPDLWVVYDGANFLNFNGQRGAWQYFDGTNLIHYDATAAQWKNPDGSNATYAGVAPSQPAAFCYDPLGVANYLPGTPAYASFPYGRPIIDRFPGGQRMPVMIRAGMARFSSPSALNLQVMTPFQSVSPQMAETACFSHDEVRLLRQGTPTDPALLSFETDTALPLNMRPHVEPDRQFSWFATMVPKSDGFNDEYVLSIVVVHRRPLPIGTPDPLGERVTGIVLADGVTGGDAVLNGASEDDVKVQSGDWILLVGTSTTATGNGATAEDPFARYAWYRVVNSEAEIDSTTTPGNFARNVTLFGPDWNIPSATTYAVLVTGVKGVYERTIRVQRSSLWY